MGTLVLNGATSGSTTIQPTDAATVTATLPGATGTIMVSGNMPAFSAYRSTTQSVTVNTYTKVQCDTKEFDTNSNYDNATNYRFTPTVAGYYQINGGVFGAGTTMTAGIIKIYKNGSAYKQGVVAGANGSANEGMVVSSIVYFNGSTDYVELYAYVVAASGGSFVGGIDQTWFNGCLLRAA